MPNFAKFILKVTKTSIQNTSYNQYFTCNLAPGTCNLTLVTDSKAPETKINVRERIVKLMKDNNYEPFLELIRIGKDPDSNLKLRADIASTLAEFVAPKLKGIDVDSKTSGSVRVVVQTFAEVEEQAKTLEMALCLDSEEKETPSSGN